MRSRICRLRQRLNDYAESEAVICDEEEDEPGQEKYPGRLIRIVDSILLFWENRWTDKNRHVEPSNPDSAYEIKTQRH